MIAIIDYGVGNLFSLRSSLRYLGYDSCISGDPEILKNADKLLLPGVGAFGDAMDKLRVNGLDRVVKSLALSGKPLLGVCLGMQMLFEESEEFGKHEGLGLIKGRVCAMEPALRAAGFDYKVPQIGWNGLEIRDVDCPLLKDVKENDYVYYVHSYYACDCEESIAAGSEYGVFVPGVVSSKNVFGTQFHPEKSGKVGLDILRAFCEVEL